MTTTAPEKKKAAKPLPATIDVIQGGVSALEIPRDLGAEAGAIGSMILDSNSIAVVTSFLPNPEMFFDHRNQVIYKVILEILTAGSHFDAMILHAELRNRGLLAEVGGIDYIKDLANAVPTSFHAATYAAHVKEKWMKRNAISALLSALREVYECPNGYRPAAASECIENAIAGLMQVGANETYRVARSLREIVKEVRDELTSDATPSGMMTKYTELDEYTTGLHRGEMILIAARPSVGKTALAVNIIQQIGLYGDHNILMFSLEQRDKELIMRMLSGGSGVNSHTLRLRKMNGAEWARFNAAADELGVDNIFIDDTPSLTLTDLFTKSRRLHSRRPLSLVVIDYIQLMECGGQKDRQQEITKISRGIKALARELNIPVIALSQLNRASETEKRMPRMSDLRESGSLEQDADVVLLLHREAVLHRGDEQWMEANRSTLSDAYLIIGKQRNGPCETVKLTFLPSQTRFENYTAGVL